MSATDFLVIYGFPDGSEPYCETSLREYLQRVLGCTELDLEAGVAIIPVDSAATALRTMADIRRQTFGPLSIRLRCRHVSATQAAAVVAKMTAEEKNQLQEAGKALLREHGEEELRQLLRARFELALVFRAAIAG